MGVEGHSGTLEPELAAIYIYGRPPLIRPGDDSKTSFSTIGLDKEIGDSQYMAPNTSF